jgi:hypothetical protein
MLAFMFSSSSTRSRTWSTVSSEQITSALPAQKKIGLILTFQDSPKLKITVSVFESNRVQDAEGYEGGNSARRRQHCHDSLIVSLAGAIDSVANYKVETVRSIRISFFGDVLILPLARAHIL